MSQELDAFFAKVTEDRSLQEKLYVTREISDVAVIAKEWGFHISGAEILQAQAGRVLSIPLEELEIVAEGKKSKVCCQWGRGGKGYLDNTGFWIITFVQWGYMSDSDPNMMAFLEKVKNDKGLQADLLQAKTHKAVSEIANREGFEIPGVALLKHQAAQILKLDSQHAEKVASGAEE